MTLTIGGLVVASLIALTAWATWVCAEEFGRDVGRSEGFDEGFECGRLNGQRHLYPLEGTTQEKK